MKKTERVLAAIADGCETVADIEADLDFMVTRHRIAALVAYLKRRGRIVKVGEAIVEVDRLVRGRPEVGGFRTFRYRVAEDPAP